MNTSLMAEAASLDAEADSLVERTRELRRQAAELRVQATKDDRRVGIVARRSPRAKASEKIGVRDVEKLVKVIETIGAASVAALADHLGVSEARVRALCAAGQEMGLICPVGAKKKWALLEDGGAAPVEEVKSPEQVVRDAMVGLDTFTEDQLVFTTELDPGVVRRQLTKAIEKKIVKGEMVNGTMLYDYMTPEKILTTRRRRITPAEMEVVDRTDVLSDTPASARTSHRRGVKGSASKRLISEVVKNGAQIVPGGKHLKVVKNGKVLGTLQRGKNTEGDLAAARREISKGLKV